MTDTRPGQEFSDAFACAMLATVNYFGAFLMLIISWSAYSRINGRVWLYSAVPGAIFLTFAVILTIMGARSKRLK